MRRSKEDPYFESATYLDGKPFRKYAFLVLLAIRSAPGPVATRQIHEMLGELARPAWTADALEWNAGEIEAVGMHPTRYRPAADRRRRSSLPFNRTLSPLSEADVQRRACPSLSGSSSSGPGSSPGQMPNRQRLSLTVDDIAAA